MVENKNKMNKNRVWIEICVGTKGGGGEMKFHVTPLILLH